MCQSLDLTAARALAARVAVAARLAVDVLRVGYGQRQRARACRAREELRVAYAAAVDALGEVAFQRLLSYYV